MSGKAIRETFTALIMIASLLFVGWEIRQNTVASRAQAYQALGIATATLFDTQAHDRQFTGPDKGAASMDTTDWRKWALKMTAYARIGETILLQVEEGLLPPKSMTTLGYAGWRTIFQSPENACIWPLIRPGVSEGFRQYVEEGQNPDAIDCSEFSIPQRF